MLLREPYAHVTVTHFLVQILMVTCFHVSCCVWLSHCILHGFPDFFVYLCICISALLFPSVQSLSSVSYISLGQFACLVWVKHHYHPLAGRECRTGWSWGIILFFLKLLRTEAFYYFSVTNCVLKTSEYLYTLNRCKGMWKLRGLCTEVPFFWYILLRVVLDLNVLFITSAPRCHMRVGLSTNFWETT